MVRLLVRELEANFNWKGLDYLEAPPLFVAIMCDYTLNQSTIKLLIDEDRATNNESPAILNYTIMSSAILTRT